VNAKNIAGWAALIIAAWGGHKESIQLLLEYGANVNISRYNEQTALHSVSNYRNKAVVQLCIENGG